MNVYNATITQKVLEQYHNGYPISDNDLNIALKEIEQIHAVFSGLSIPSMPEYSVFRKALQKDYMDLTEFNRYRSRK